MSWCVYGITGAAARRVRATGLRGEPLVLIRAAGLAAIAGALGRLPVATEQNLVAYHRVQQRLFAELPAFLPARYGSVMPRADVRSLLEARRGVFRRALAGVRGRAQMTLRLAGGRSGSPSLRRNGGTERAAGGAAYLRAKVAEASSAASAFEPLRPAVRRWVRAERVERRNDSVSIYHLVPRRAAAAYRNALVRSARALGIAIVVTGPFAPYAFAEPSATAGRWLDPEPFAAATRAPRASARRRPSARAR